MGGACNTNWEIRNAYRILVGKPEGKKSLGIPRRRWADNIKMGLINIFLNPILFAICTSTFSKLCVTYTLTCRTELSSAPL
jgi:hypothetical protein